MCLKENGKMIGDCGLTLQPIGNTIKPEIGYHIQKTCQRKGYAKEAAIVVRDWAFTYTPFQTIYSYMKSTNLPSMQTAQGSCICGCGKTKNDSVCPLEKNMA